MSAVHPSIRPELATTEEGAARIGASMWRHHRVPVEAGAPAPESLALADNILEDMRGGPILDVGPERSRLLLARWVERLVMAEPVAEETEAAVLAERQRCANIAKRYGPAGESGCIAAEILGVPYVCPPLSPPRHP